MKQLTGKSYSEKQESQIAKMVGGRVQSNSGGTRFGGGDVHTKTMFIEAKTPTTAKNTFSIQKQWMEKAKQQAFEQNKTGYALAFRFAPDEPDYFVISSQLFKELINYLEEDNRNEQ